MKGQEQRRIQDLASILRFSSIDGKSLLSSEIWRISASSCLPDDIVRRQLFSVVESVLITVWQESYFGKNCLDGAAFHFVLFVYDKLREMAPKIQFQPVSLWFGGEQTGLKADVLDNTIKFLSSCWHAAALIVNIREKNEIQDFLRLLIRFIPSTCCLATILLSQDERCLSVAVALLYLEKAGISAASQLKALHLFRHILLSISYDHKVIMDWLYSEMASIPFVLRFLTVFINQQSDPYSDDCNSFCQRCIERNKKGIRFERIRTTFSSGYIKLRVRQLHGDLPVTTSYKFSKCEREVCVMGCNMNVEKGSDQRIVECFKRLNDLCVKIDSSDHAPFSLKPVIAMCDLIAKKSEGV